MISTYIFFKEQKNYSCTYTVAFNLMVFLIFYTESVDVEI